MATDEPTSNPNLSTSFPIRVAGAVLGGSLSTFAAGLSQLTEFYWTQWFGPVVPLLGIVVGVALGFVVAPAALRSRHPWLSAVGYGFLAVLLGILGLVVIGIATAPRAEGLTLTALVGGALFYAAYGFMFGPPITVPIALVAVGILRLGRRNLRAGIAAVVGVCVLAFASIGLSGLGARLPLPSLPTGEPVELTLVVVNHSDRWLQLGAFEHHEDGYGGSILGIEPCFTTVETFRLGTAWFLTLDPDSEARTPPDLISAADAPGPAPVVRLEIPARGRASVSSASSVPDEAELTVDHCLNRQQP